MSEDLIFDLLKDNPGRVFKAREIWVELSKQLNLSNIYRHLRRLSHYHEVRRTKTGWYYTNKEA